MHQPADPSPRHSHSRPDSRTGERLNHLLCQRLGDTIDFFRDVARALSEEFEIDHVVVARVCAPPRQRATSLAYWHGGYHQQNFEYPLKNTPCADVYTGSPSYFRDNVKETFPSLDQLFPVPLRSYYGLPLRNSQDEPIGHIALLHSAPIDLSEDLVHFGSLIAIRTALHLQQIELKESLDQKIHTLQQTTENLPGVVYRFVMDEEGEVAFTYVSPRSVDILGVEPEWLLEDPWLLPNMSPSEDRRSMLQAITRSAQRLENYDWTGPMRIRNEMRYVHMHSHPIRLPNGTVEWSGYLTDVTDIKRTEEALSRSDEQLRRSQKMDAIGRLAGGIAHDFNNLLTAILGFGELAMSSVSASHPANASLQEIQRAGERAQELTRKLVAAGRKQILETAPIDLDEIILELEPLLLRTLGEDIELVIDSRATRTVLNADKGSLEQILINLAVNARDAMPSGGRLIIRTEHRTSREGPAATPALESQVLTIRDTGQGIDKNNLERIFEPFFTTKAEGKGSGLGLSVVYGIVEQLGGSIHVESDPGEGTTFELVFPTCHEAPKILPLKRVEQLQRGHEAILVVEDDGAVRRFINRCLTALGYRVLEADSGALALEICRSDQPIDLLLTDVVMPNMSGPELLQQARTFRPSMRHLFITGFTQDGHLLKDLDQGTTNVLLKPFTREQLGQRLREILTASNRGPANDIEIREAQG